MELGQIGYEAYRNSTDGISLVTGATIPPWKLLNSSVQNAWAIAAAAVAMHAMDEYSTELNGRLQKLGQKLPIPPQEGQI